MESINKELFDMQRKNSSEYKIQKCLPRLRQQWSLKEDRHCLHQSWEALATAVGLGMGDLQHLKDWVAQNGLKAPVRIKIKS